MASQLSNLSVVTASAQFNNTVYNYNIALNCDTAENDNFASFYKPAQLLTQLSNTALYKFIFYKPVPYKPVFYKSVN